jgi:hypothetical protein
MRAAAAAGANRMLCPYCAEDVKDQAIVCKHCGRDLLFLRPVMSALDGLNERLDRLERRAIASPADSDGAAALPAPLSIAVATAAGIDRRVPVLSPFAALALTFILLVAAHFIIIVQLDLSLIWLRLVSILVPMIFGFMFRGSTPYGLFGDFAAGLLVAILAILTMSAVVGKLESVPVLPRDAQGWLEFAEYGASITFGFFTGAMARHGLIAFRSASLGSNRLIRTLSTYIAMKTGKDEGDGAEPELKKRLGQIESMISSAIAIGSAVISVVTGLYQFIQ